MKEHKKVVLNLSQKAEGILVALVAENGTPSIFSELIIDISTSQLPSVFLLKVKNASTSATEVKQKTNIQNNPNNKNCVFRRRL